MKTLITASLLLSSFCLQASEIKDTFDCTIYEDQKEVATINFGTAHPFLSRTTKITPKGLSVSVFAGSGLRLVLPEGTGGAFTRYVDVEIRNDKGEEIIKQYSSVAGNSEYVLDLTKPDVFVGCHSSIGW